MDRTFWHKQTLAQPLFPDLLWSRPENKRTAGKLLIIGGNAQGFAAAGEAYAQAVSAGIGIARALLPDSLQKSLGGVFEAGQYAPSTPSGSFSSQALAEFLAQSSWADGVLLAGDLGRNSETAVLAEHYVEKYQGQLTITKDAADYFINTPGPLLARPQTVLVLSLGQLQKLARGARFTRAFISDMALLSLLDALHEFTKRYDVSLIVRHQERIVVAVNSQISTTPVPANPKIWRLKTATAASVWWLQNPGRPFEAMTTSLVGTNS